MIIFELLYGLESRLPRPRKLTLYKVSEGFPANVSNGAAHGVKMATKTHYKVAQKLEAFYAGGALSFAKSGELIACAYYDEVKVSIYESNSWYTCLMKCIASWCNSFCLAGGAIRYWVRSEYIHRGEASSTTADIGLQMTSRD